MDQGAKVILFLLYCSSYVQLVRFLFSSKKFFLRLQRQLRETVFNFCQKELAPLAAEIDRENNFDKMRPFWRKLGDLGLLGITADPDYGGSGMGWVIPEGVSELGGAGRGEDYCGTI